MVLFLSSRLLEGGNARLHAKYMLNIKEITRLFSPVAASCDILSHGGPTFS